MGLLYALLILVFSPTSGVSKVTPALTVIHGAYQGEVATGLQLQWRQRHSVEIGLGFYPLEDVHYPQLNTGYHYSAIQKHSPKYNWDILRLGITAMKSLDGKKYFTKAPDRYPTPDYYSQIGLRLGLAIGSGVIFNKQRFGLSYELVCLDQAFIVVYNNDLRDATPFVGAGVKLIYFL